MLVAYELSRKPNDNVRQLRASSRNRYEIKKKDSGTYRGSVMGLPCDVGVKGG